MEKIIIDYKVVTQTVLTGFWGETLPEQPHFEKAVKELLNKGYIPLDELKTTSGSAGGFFSSSQYPTLSQALVLYGTSEEKMAFETEEKRKAAEQRKQTEEQKAKEWELEKKLFPQRVIATIVIIAIFIMLVFF